MLKTAGQQIVRVAEKLRGGEGTITFHEFLSKDESYGAGRLFSRSTLPAGASIGAHVREGEYEVYYVLSGEAEIIDNGTPIRLKAGDTHLSPRGQSHALKNPGPGELEMMMLILFENPAHQ
ncbi:MAG TPA: cupin domain-containing protein [Feifaniaceae bacterium]|nr:cupin domain-containing protein [Feifaniaceae bacterium]